MGSPSGSSEGRESRAGIYSAFLLAVSVSLPVSLTQGHGLSAFSLFFHLITPLPPPLSPLVSEPARFGALQYPGAPCSLGMPF